MINRQLISEINTINRILAQFGVEPGSRDRAGRPVYVHPRQVVASATGNFVRYPISTLGKQSKIKSLADELGDALSAARGTLLDVQWARPLAIELPHPAPRPLAWSLADLESLGPGQCTPGRNYANGSPHPVVVDLASATSPHAMVAATTGGGKSTAIVNMLASLTWSSGPSQWALVILDPKPAQEPDLGLLGQLPHLLLPVVTDPQESVDALGQVVAEMERRKREGWDGSQRILVVVDELAELMITAGEQVEAWLTRILSVGRGLGIHMLVATQKPLASVIGSLVKGNIPVTLAGMVANVTDSNTVAPGHGLDAHKLPGLGSFYMVLGGRVTRLQSHYLPDVELGPQLAENARRWQGETPTVTLGATYTPPPAPDSTAAQAAAVLAQYRPEELIQQDGQPARGAQTWVIDVLYADDPKRQNGGYYRKTALAVLDWIRSQGHTAQPEMARA